MNGIRRIMNRFDVNDRVTIRNVPGEWQVLRGDGAYLIYGSPAYQLKLIDGGGRVWAAEHDMELVKPPLPPEPPEGSGVFVDGKAWWRTSSPSDDQWATHETGERHGWRYAQWSEIAYRATPAVPLADVLQALVAWSDDDINSRTAHTPSERIERLFGVRRDHYR
jgi:hypothetical protein